MSEGHGHRLFSIFEEAIDLPEDEREEFVLDRAGGDVELLAGVRQLLESRRPPGSGIDAPDGDRLSSSLRRHLARSLEGARIGGYRVLRPLAMGGMGAVYEAEQERPRRSVALKIVRIDAADDAVLRRLRYESELLARLRHPGIAQVHDAGSMALEDGVELPYFAMELVEGARDLLSHAREERLDLDARLDLFSEICEAVQHAHQQGVVHRDLKPGNILVGTDGRPKLIDFGIARDLEADLTGADWTREGVVPGTLRYVAPEVLDGRVPRADTRSDVYALGVILYELICDRPPFQVEGLSPESAVRTLAHAAPIRPCLARPGLARELEWIVLRAMDGMPAERYASAEELAADIQRYRRLEPVLAGPPTTRYRLRVLLRRHRLAAALIAASVLSLAVVGSIAAIGWVLAAAAQEEAEEAKGDAEAEAARAQEEAEIQETVTTFLVSLFGSARPNKLGRDVRLLDVLHIASDSVDEQLAGRPLHVGHVRFILGKSFLELEMVSDARFETERAIAEVEPILEPDHLLLARARVQLARILLAMEDPEAVAALRGAVDLAKRAVGTDHWFTLDVELALAKALRNRGEDEEARAILDANLHLLDDGAIDSPVEGSLALLGAELRLGDGDFRSSRELLEHARGHLSALGPAGEPNLVRLGMLELELGKADGTPSAELFEQARALVEESYRLFGPTSMMTVRARFEHARLLELVGTVDDVVGAHEQGIVECLGIDPLLTCYAVDHLTRLANFLEAKGEPESALDLFDRFREELIDFLGATHPYAVLLEFAYVDSLLASGRNDEALRSARDARELLLAELPPGHRSACLAGAALGRALCRKGLHDEAEEVMTEHVDDMVEGERSRSHATLLTELSGCRIHQGESEEALDLQRRALVQMARAYGHAFGRTLEVRRRLAVTLLRIDPEEALELADEGLRLVTERTQGFVAVGLLEARAHALERSGRLEEALSCVEQCLIETRAPGSQRASRVPMLEEMERELRERLAAAAAESAP